jgi:chaperonin cofactor prefoldin
VIEALDSTEEFLVEVEEAVERINLQIEELEQEKEEWLDAVDVMHSKLQEWFGEDMIPGHID